MSVVFALATPPAKSAICIFRVSGAGCHSVLGQIFSRDVFCPNKFSVATMSYGGKVIDRVGLVVFNGPKSYTGEDSFELYAHGSLAIMSNIVDVFKGLGFEEAPGGEFTKRAFLNNKITLVEAEAVSDLIDSTDSRGVVLSNKTLFGELSSKVVLFGEEIDAVRVKVEGEIDFSDEDNDYFDSSLITTLDSLIERFGLFIGACVSKKIGDEKNNVVLAGPVNSGKSSVFNRLLGFERAIVSNTPGTTRDMIGSELFYKSNSFSIYDTAGIRKTSDVIEKRGIDISISEIKNADLVLGIFENNNPDEIDYFKKMCGDKNFICIQNKSDLNKKDVDFDCSVSAKTGEGFAELKSLIEKSFKSDIKNNEYDFLIKERHGKLFDLVLDNLKKAKANLSEHNNLELAAEDLKNARSSLDQVIGKKFSDSLLGDIFSSFCIGK